MSEASWLFGRAAMVTGAASGLGRATAAALAAAGASVIAADVDESGLALSVEEILKAGGSAEALCFDVADDLGRRSAVGRALAGYGDSFDILVNVAGIDRPGYADDLSLADFERVLAVNLTGPTFLFQEFVRAVKGRTPPHPAEVVNVISISAITVGTGAAAYNGSKAAFAKVTEVFQREILEFGWPVRLQGIMPAAMDTPMMERWGIPPERMMPPSVVAEEILHCLRRPAAAYGQNLVVVPRSEPDFPR